MAETYLSFPTYPRWCKGPGQSLLLHIRWHSSQRATPDQEGTSNTIPCQLLGLKHFMIASISSVSRVKGPFKKTTKKRPKTTKQAQDSPMFDGQNPAIFGYQWTGVTTAGIDDHRAFYVESVWYEEFLCINMHRSFSTNSPPKSDA